MPPKMQRRVWSIADLLQLMIATTACLCLLIVVLGVMIGVMQQKISAALLGDINHLGVAGGLVGILWILYLIISRTLAVSSGRDATQSALSEVSDGGNKRG